MQVFHEMMNGDFSRVASIFTPPGAGAKCPVVDDSYNRPWNSDATTAVICGDRPDQRNFTFTDLKEVVAGFRELSPDFGDLWVRHSVPCINWPYRPADRFAGPFGTPKPDSPRVEGKPTAPILFSGSEIDPVTPLSAARKMSKLHPESGVLVMAGSGHSNLHDPSPCRKKYISQYWSTGEMPPEDLICEMDCKPFYDVNGWGLGKLARTPSAEAAISCRERLCNLNVVVYPHAVVHSACMHGLSELHPHNIIVKTEQ